MKGIISRFEVKIKCRKRLQAFWPSVNVLSLKLERKNKWKIG